MPITLAAFVLVSRIWEPGKSGPGAVDNSVTNFTTPGDIAENLSTTLGISRDRLTRVEEAGSLTSASRARPPEAEGRKARTT